jgi:hypothetical protein
MSPREKTMVPRAEFQSYYGKPVLKKPTWKSPDVPAYLALGGLAGASAVIAQGASLTGRDGLARASRVAAAAGSAAGVGALVHDLGRPGRFLNMLRVFKPTSPLSVGSWILAPFSGLSAVSAASAVTGVAPWLGRLAGAGATLLGGPLATYTAALISDTAVPAWHNGYREMPFVFAGSAISAAAGAALLGAPVEECGPVRRLAVLGAGMELAAEQVMTSRLGMVAEAYEQEPLQRVSQGLTLAGTAGALIGRRSRVVSALSGATLLAASYLGRKSIFDAGIASAEDPKYTVVPQRERLASRA